MRNVLGIYSSPAQHWVGDGFPVRSMLSYATLGEHVSPFLHLDHAGPASFPPAERPRGVGAHPHRGFETVTIVIRVRSSIVTRRVRAASSGRATCNG